jgi:hypothetical protein
MKTKQNIFKNIGGFNVILSIIEMVEINIEPLASFIFRENSNPELRNRMVSKRSASFNNQMNINEKLLDNVIKIMKNCYSILGFCCQDNPKNQE